MVIGSLSFGQPAYADCAGNEVPGTGVAPLTDVNKCYLNSVATSNTPAGSQASGTDTAETGTNCAIEKVGWILCPIMESAAKISDNMFDVLADNFLHTDPKLFSDSSGTKVAWEVARNLANVMFIIAFLFIIFSQVTGQGLNNYGIKKMLPRLVIAAIAVNASYYICQLAVDITNILGYAIQDALAGIANDIGPSVFGQVGNFTSGQTDIANASNSSILTVIIVGALASAAAVWVIVSQAMAIITVVLITVLTILIILLLRKALIVLLIVLAPIAFVMYLLPNTEKLFTKWYKMFGQLLMVFPIVALLFGAGQLASTIILVSGAQVPPATSQCNAGGESTAATNTGSGVGSSVLGGLNKQGDTNNASSYNQKCDEYIRISGGRNGTEATDLGGKGVSWSLGLVATAVAIVPLLAVWAVLKGALSAAGAIGGKLSNSVEKGVSRGVAGGAKGGKQAWEASAFGRGYAQRKSEKKNFKDKQFAHRMASSDGKFRSRYTQIAARGVSGNLGRIDALKDTAFGAQNSGLDARFAGAAAKIEDQEVNDKKALYQQALRENPTEDAVKYLRGKMENGLSSGDLTSAIAAQEMLNNQGKGGVNAVRETFRSIDKNLLKTDAVTFARFKQNISQNQSALKGSDADVYAYANKGHDADQINKSTGKMWTIDDIRDDKGTFAGITNEQMAGQSSFALNGSTGAANALNEEQTVVFSDENGKPITSKVARKVAIINSDAAKIIKDENMSHFN